MRPESRQISRFVNTSNLSGAILPAFVLVSSFVAGLENNIQDADKISGYNELSASADLIDQAWA